MTTYVYLIKLKFNQSTAVHYDLDPQSIEFDFHEGLLKGQLSSIDSVALELRAWFYEEGIMRILIGEKDSDRFRISQHGISVEEGNLVPLEDIQQYVTRDKDQGTKIRYNSQDGKDEYEYLIANRPFKIELTVNDRLALVVNPANTLYYENGGQLTPEGTPSESDVHDEFGWPMLINYDYETSVAIGFFAPTPHMYGIPGRESAFNLNTTQDEEGPYRLFNRDLDPHWAHNKTELYGSIPYLTAHSDTFDSSVAWMNSADTWVDILPMDFENHKGRYFDFLSEGGALEFFTFGSATHPARVQKNLQHITGYLELPPINTLGFHFSKWGPVSADMVTERSQNFTDTKFPVDIFWMDIEHALWAEKETPETRDYKWFTFNPHNYTQTSLSALKTEMEQSKRRLVTIIDPHIKVEKGYFVYDDGLELQDSKWEEGDAKNIYVRNVEGKTLYAEAWPGNSTFMDFLNTNAQEFWINQFPKFEGTNHLFYAWNDVNDPCVFNGPLKTMPVQFIHIQKDGTKVLHRDVHNAYGTLEHWSSYRGIMKRDGANLRPFILSRSFFFGSQKLGPSWTGDTQALMGEPWGSLNELLSQGVAGHPFAGADIPGYKLVPPENLWVMMYQLGMFYPFFRAHNEINYQEREPWLQPQRIQKVISDSISLRYDLIHYIYGMFYEGNRFGRPLLRAMWYEFPQDRELITLETQFMFGGSILVCPKLSQDSATAANDGSINWTVNCTLPMKYAAAATQREDALWYNWYSKASQGGSSGQVTLPDDQQGIWVKGGSIIPLLQHSAEMSILQAIDNPVSLDIYLDKQDGKASGYIYLDDGQTFNYRDKCEQTLVEFTYVPNEKTGSTLVAEKRVGDECSYAGAASKLIKEANIYGVAHEPDRVLCSKTGTELEFKFDIETKHLNIKISSLSVDDGLVSFEKTSLFEVHLKKSAKKIQAGQSTVGSFLQ